MQWNLNRLCWSRGQKTHLAHRGTMQSFNSHKSTTRSGTDLLFSSHGLPKCLLWAGYRGGLSKVLYANELLINYLLNFPSQGGRGLEHCRAAPRPVSSCLPSIKASLPGDWFRRLVAPQANAKVIYLSWGVYMRPGGNISHCLPKWDTTSKQRRMGGASVIIWHMLNGSLRMMYPVPALMNL